MFYISIFQKWFCCACCSSKRCKQKITLTWASEWVMKWFELTKCSLFYCQTLLILKWFVDRYKIQLNPTQPNLFPLSLLQVSLSCLPSKFLSLWRPLLQVKVSTYSLLLSLTHLLTHSLTHSLTPLILLPLSAIGRGGTLPWKIPGDMAYFKQVTSNTYSPETHENVVIMGRKTWEVRTGPTKWSSSVHCEKFKNCYLTWLYFTWFCSQFLPSFAPWLVEETLFSVASPESKYNILYLLSYLCHLET